MTTLHLSKSTSIIIQFFIIPKYWQSYLQHNKFSIIQCSVHDFLDMMECYQVADNINPLLKQQNQSKIDKDESNKSLEKSIDKSKAQGQVEKK
jgi:hypothetical protein